MSTSAIVNIKHQTWNSELVTWNMKYERKHEMGGKQFFGVFKKWLHETLNIKHEIGYLKYATMYIKYEYLCNS